MSIAYRYTGPAGLHPAHGLIPRDLTAADYDALAAHYGARVLGKYWHPIAEADTDTPTTEETTT